MKNKEHQSLQQQFLTETVVTDTSTKNSLDNDDILLSELTQDSLPHTEVINDVDDDTNSLEELRLKMMPPTTKVKYFKYTMCGEKTGIIDVWGEWYGLNYYCSEINENCGKGGVQELEKKYKSNWRTDYCMAQKKHLLRCKNIVRIIGFISHVSGEEESKVLLHVDAHLRNLSKMKIGCNINKK